MNLTVVEKLIIAALQIDDESGVAFTAEDLVVIAWKKFPDTFGLKSYLDDKGNPAYPDSNRVFAEIMGSKPIRQRGYLQKVGRKMYQLTEAGRAEAVRISKINTSSPLRKLSIPRDTIIELQKLLESKVLSKYLNEQTDLITFFDACAFWNISPRSTAIELTGKLANIENIIKLAKDSIGSGEASTTHRGNIITSSDLNLLNNAHNYLKKRFESEINIIRERTDERK